MKLHFEPDLDYQLQAIEAVCDLFRGQEICRTEFTVTRDAMAPQMRLGFAESDLGIGNRLHAARRRDAGEPAATSSSATACAPSGIAGLRRLHRRDGDRHRQDLRLPAHHLRAEQALRLHQVRHRGARRSRSRRASTRRSRSPRTTSRASTPACPSTTSSTTPPSSARCATSPPARTSRSWW